MTSYADYRNLTSRAFWFFQLIVFLYNYIELDVLFTFHLDDTLIFVYQYTFVFCL